MRNEGYRGSRPCATTKMLSRRRQSSLSHTHTYTHVEKKPRSQKRGFHYPTRVRVLPIIIFRGNTFCADFGLKPHLSFYDYTWQTRPPPQCVPGTVLWDWIPLPSLTTPRPICDCGRERERVFIFGSSPSDKKRTYSSTTWLPPSSSSKAAN